MPIVFEKGERGSLPSSNRLIRMKLIELYRKCGAFEDTRQVFN